MNKMKYLFCILFGFSTISANMYSSENKNPESYESIYDILKSRFEVKLVSKLLVDSVRKNELSRVQYLVENENIDINATDFDGYTPIIASIEIGNNKIFDYLIEKNADLSAKDPVFGRTVLHTAIYYENFYAFKKLIEMDEKLVKEKNELDGWTPLHNAVLKDNIDMIEILLEKGANPYSENHLGVTPIDMAKIKGKGRAMKAMRDHVKSMRK